MDTAITTENENDASYTHEDETIVNDLPKKVKSVWVWGGVPYLEYHVTVHVHVFFMYVWLYSNVPHVYIIMRNRTELPIAINISLSYMYTIAIVTLSPTLRVLQHC